MPFCSLRVLRRQKTGGWGILHLTKTSDTCAGIRHIIGVLGPVQNSYSLSAFLGLATVVLVSACDGARVAGPPAEAGNVETMIGAAVVESETGVIVDGHPVVSYPSNGRALWLDRFERYDFGGFPEIGYAQHTRYALSWHVTLAHGHPPEQRGDSTVFRFFDHGDATVADVLMDRLTDPPHVPSGVPVRFENVVRYHLPTFTYAEWEHGGSTIFHQTAFHDDLVAGRDLSIRTTGSDDVLPVHATFAVRAFARLNGIENGEPLSLVGGKPSVDVDRAFVLNFDRPLDPSRAFILLHPMDPTQPGARPAFIRPVVPTRRVVIPPYALQQLAEIGADSSIPFRALIIEIMVTDDAFSGHLTTEPFTLPFVQRSETSIHLYLGREP